MLYLCIYTSVVSVYIYQCYICVLRGITKWFNKEKDFGSFDVFVHFVAIQGYRTFVKGNVLSLSYCSRKNLQVLAVCLSVCLHRGFSATKIMNFRSFEINDVSHIKWQLQMLLLVHHQSP